MIWEKIHPDEVGESVLVCTSTSIAEIGLAVRELIERMAAEWQAEGHPKAEAVFMDINATNGHIFFTWDNLAGGANFYEEGWPTYYLKLKELWRESLEHKKGADHFDKVARLALCEEVKRVRLLAKETGIKDRYIYYAKFEGRRRVKRLIA